MIPTELRYSKEHEWVRREGEEIVVGITDYAQEKLGEVVYVELPPLGKNLAISGVMAVVESFKAASEVYTPLSGIVTAINSNLATNPGLINKDPYGEGWLIRLKPTASTEWGNLLTPSDYEKLTQGEK